jgi:transcriptional regulator with XRE-family HTH domain
LGAAHVHRKRLRMFSFMSTRSRRSSVPSSGQGPTVRRRRLGIELRRLRELAGLTGDEVAERLEWSHSKVSRIETGRIAVHPNDVRLLLDLYAVEDHETRAALVALAREGRQKGWWHAFNDVLSKRHALYIGLEAAAESISVFAPLVVPGLLQTQRYARSVIRGGPAQLLDVDIERLVEVRQARQELLAKDDGPRYWAVFDEAVVRRRLGGDDVMREQLERLIGATSRPRTTIQIIPFGARGHAAITGPFAIFGFPELADPEIVYMETVAGELYLERREEVRSGRQAFEHLQALALSPGDSISFLEELTRE